MKKSIAAKVATAVVAGTMALFAFGLAGCVQMGGSDTERIAELEAEIESLKAQQDETTESQNNSADEGNQQQQKDQEHKSSASTQEITDKTALDFSKRADELIAEADAATPPSDRSKLVSTYFDFDARFEALEDEIDRYGDQKEMEYRNGTLEWEEYRTLDLQLDSIEDRLDASHDSLEWRFGVDD